MSATVKLIGKNDDIYKISASDIAISAGIAKGSLYNYFQSKEEIIARAILYRMHLRIKKLSDNINATQGFKDKLNIIFETIRECMAVGESVFDLLSPFIDNRQMKKIIEQSGQVLMEIREKTKKTVLDILLAGIEEGLFSQHEQGYTRQVFFGCMSSFAYIFIDNENPTKELVEKAKENSYNMLIRSLK